MKLYVTPTSPYGRLAMIARLEKGLADRIVLVWTRTRIPDNPEYAFNPSGRIPFLQLDDGTGFEDTDVIVDYLDALAPPHRLRPDDAQENWTYRRHESLARSMLDGASVWVRELVRPETERSPGTIAHETARAERLADLFEAEVATGTFQGPINMAQMLLFCALDLERRIPDYDWRTGRPALVAWHEAMMQQPSVSGSQPPAGV